MGILKDKRFWLGVGVGVFVMPMVMAKVPALGNLRAKIPA
jgi:hypothetical protein